MNLMETNLSARERSIIEEINDTAHALPDPFLPEKIAAVLERCKDNPAILTSTRSYTYAEFAEDIRKEASWCRKNGLEKGETAAVMFRKGYPQIAAVYGAVYAGIAYAPIEYDLPPARVAAYIESAGAKILITDRKNQLRLEQSGHCAGIRIVDWDEIIRGESGSGDVMYGLVRGDDHFATIFTSGSTGVPKGVVFTYNSMRNYTEHTLWFFHITEQSRNISVSNICHDMSLAEVFTTLLAGGSLVVPDPEYEKEPAHWAELMQRYHVSAWTTVPTVANMLMLASQNENLQYPDLKVMVLGGEFVPIHLLKVIYAHCPDITVYTMGGPTETTCWNILHKVVPEDLNKSVIPYGRPIWNSVYYILDQDLQIVPPGVTGMIWNSGACVNQGYTDPELTREKFIVHPKFHVRMYNTGDLGKYNEKGYIEILGRSDSQVKINGKRIELEEIENRISQHPAVRQAAVVNNHETISAYCTIDRSEMEQKNVDHWEAIFNETYDVNREKQEGRQDFSGWINSYTYQPFPMEEKRDTNRSAVRRIRKIAGKRMFEIGCGTGLILNEFAKDSELYVGIDISEVAIRNLRKEIREKGFRNASVYCGAADRLEPFRSETYDTIIMNSVSQFFQDTEYMLKVLTQCEKMLSDGGKIFIGDVRDYSMLRLFTASVIRYNFPEDNREALLKRLEERLRMEKEVTYSQSLFLDVTKTIPSLNRVVINTKPNRYNNEFNKYRYDVILYKNAPAGQREEVVFDELDHPVPDCQILSAAKSGKNVRIKNAINRYVAQDFAEYSRAIGRRCGIREQDAEEARIPDDYFRLAEENGCTCCISADPEGRMEIRFGKEVYSDTSQAKIIDPASDEYANVPYRGMSYEELKDSLHSYASEYLPSYMVPARFVFLDHLPLLGNGKIDRKTLKGYYGGTGRKEQDESRKAGETPEAYIRRLYKDMFREEIDPDDSFFMIGGHSLLAMRLLNHIRKNLGVKIRLSEFLLQPTMRYLLEETGRRGRERDQLEDYIIREPEKMDQPFRLNAIQRSYYHGRASSMLGGVPTCMYHEFIVKNLDVSRFETALNQLVMRHEMLRTVIINEEEQRILTDPPHVSPEVTDYTVWSDEEKNRILDELYDRIYDEMTDLTGFPNFLVRIARFGEDSRIFVVLDSTFVDGASIGILIRDMKKLYDDVPLPELENNFRDYSLTVENLKHSEEYQKALSYWMARIGTLPDGPMLPVLSEHGIFSGDRVRNRTIRKEHWISDQLWRRLKDLSAKESISQFSIEVTAYAAAMARWCGESHFTLNIPIFNRAMTDDSVLRMCGEFGSLIFLEVDLEWDRGFLYNCRKLQSQFQKDMDHRLVNGVDLLENYREKGRNFNVPIVFTTLTTPSGEEGIYSGEVELRRWRSHSSQVWIDSILFNRDGGVQIAWDIRAGIFRDELLDDLFRAFIRCFSLAAESEEFLHGNMKNQIHGRNEEKIRKINATKYDYSDCPSLLHEGFMRSARAVPDRPCCITAERIFTYEEMRNCAERIALELSAQGAVPGDLVAVYMDRGWKQAAAALGILLGGMAYVPIGADWPAERIRTICRNAGIRFAVTDGMHSVRAVSEIVPDLCWCGKAPDRNRIWNPAQNPSDLAYIIYTSGSTGVPKGVLIEHQSAMNTIHTINRMFHVSEQDRTFMVSELYFDLSVYDLFGMFAAGGAVYIPSGTEKRDVSCWEHILTEHGITIWNSVPSFAQMLVVMEAGKQLNKAVLRQFLLSGDWIPLTLPEQIRKVFPDVGVTSLGGATEASVWSNYFPVRGVDPEWTSIPYGYPLDNQMMVVLNRRMEICPEYVPGDIYIGGAGLARGYLNEEEMTRRQFHEKTGDWPRLYRTGDRGLYRSDGCIEFLGRSDDQIKLNGFRIELGEIEACAQRHPDVKNAVASFDRARRQIFLYYILSAPCEPARIREHLERELPEYMQPARMMEISDIPLSVNGKVNRAMLPDIREETFRREETLTETGRELSGLYQSVLRVSCVSCDENFFRMGGDSVLAIKLLHQMTRMFGDQIRLTDIFKYPTIRKMAAYIDQITGQSDPIRHREVRGGVPLSESQKGIWFQSVSAKLHGKGNLFVLSGSVRIRTDQFDEEKMREAIRILIEDQAELRARIGEKNYVPYKTYEPSVPVPFSYDQMPETEASAAEDLLCGELSCRVSDVYGFPLFAFRAAAVKDNVTVLSMAVHHVIADAESIGIIWADLEANYERMHEGKNPEHNRPGRTFQDFAQWQQEGIAGGRYEANIRYWTRKLSAAGELSLTDQTADWDDFLCEKYSLNISREQIRNLRAFCRDNRGSFYAGVHMILNLLLYYNFDTDLVSAGVGYSGRDRSGTKDVVGPYALTGLTMTRINDRMSLAQLMECTAKSLSECMENLTLPFHTMVSQAGLPPSFGRMPFYIMADCLDTEQNGSGRMFSRFRYWQNSIPADFFLIVEQSRLNDPVYILYRKGLFQKEDVCAYAMTILELFQTVTSHSDWTVGRVMEELDGK
jgi:amino acid adenylation domain-containing protein